MMSLDIMALFRALPASVAQGMLWGIMAIGVFITFKILDFADLTVDGSLALGGAVAVMLIRGGMPPALAICIATLTGLIAGFVTGILNTVLGIPDILAGILTQLALYSINLNVMGKSNQAVSVDKYELIVSLRHISHTILVGIAFIIVLRNRARLHYTCYRLQPEHGKGAGHQYKRSQGTCSRTLKRPRRPLRRPYSSVSGQR